MPAGVFSVGEIVKHSPDVNVCVERLQGSYRVSSAACYLGHVTINYNIEWHVVIITYVHKPTTVKGLYKEKEREERDV